MQLNLNKIFGLLIILAIVLALRLCWNEIAQMVNTTKTHKVDAKKDKDTPEAADVVKAGKIEMIKKAFEAQEEAEKRGIVNPGVAALRADAEWKQRDDLAKRQRKIELVMELKQLKVDLNWRTKKLENEMQEKIDPLLQERIHLDRVIYLYKSSQKERDSASQAKAKIDKMISDMKNDLQRDISIDKTVTEAKEEDLRNEINKLGLYPIP